MRDNKLEDNLNILGFIDREDQLILMRESIAVIQPSRFEGWSTVVEDAKALGKHLIVSNIKVHLEQLSDNCSFFDPLKENELGNHIQNLLKTPKKDFPLEDYKTNIEKFGRDFLAIMN